VTQVQTVVEPACHSLTHSLTEFKLYAQLSMETLRDITSPPHSMTPEDRVRLERFSELYDKAEIYYAYDLVHQAVMSPFKTTHASTLFNVSRFLLMRTLNREPPPEVSIANVVYILAKHSMELRAFKLARFAYNKLQTLLLPAQWQAEVDMQSIIVRSKPFSDAEELQPVCYRCSTVNPLLNTQGDFCINCGAPFIRSFVTFEHLPLVEFELDVDITDVSGEARARTHTHTRERERDIHPFT
jgi:intraflagellar transport protein 122